MSVLAAALSTIAAFVAAMLLLPVLSDVVSLVMAATRRPPRRGAPQGALPRLLVLVPAHDEELLIGATIRSLRGVDYPADRLDVVVIADNCGDRTAAVARDEGATCLERTDLARRGKPFAIDWALGHLPVAEFDAVVIVDADAVVDRGFARGIAAAAPLRDKAVQTYNDVSNRAENALTRMAGVFSSVRTTLMNELKHRAGVNVPLANGLCLGTGVLARHGWTAYSICEDWEMYALLTAAGVRIENAPSARVFAQEARSLAQSSSQRRRWAAGKITVLGRYLAPLLRSRTAGWRGKLDALAELTGLGPAVHLGLAFLLAGGVWVFALPAREWIVGALVLSVARIAVYTLLAVRRDPEPVQAFLAFAYLPFYTAWRLGVQLAAFRMLGDKPWVRTERHATPIVPSVIPPSAPVAREKQTW